MRHGLPVLDTTVWEECMKMDTDCFSSAATMNTFFQYKPWLKVSWIHPRWGHWQQLDLDITRHDTLNNVLNTRNYNSADCDTDCYLVFTRVRWKPKRLFHSKQKGRTHINISRTAYSSKNQPFMWLSWSGALKQHSSECGNKTEHHMSQYLPHNTHHIWRKKGPDKHYLIM